MPQTSYFKVTSGLFFSILSTFECNRAMALKELNAFIESVGAHRDRWASQGPYVTGVYFGGSAPKGWRPMGKTLGGYYRPDTRNKAGQAHKKKLGGLLLLTGEDLARELKMPPFFEDGGTWCTAVESTMVGGVFYVQAPAVLAGRFRIIGAQEITGGEHERALVQAKAAVS